MIYECENCEAVLGSGLMSCPRCGHLFDEPVPDDALSDEAEEWVESALPVESPPLVLPSVEPPPVPPTRKTRRPLRIVWSLAAALALAGLVWAGVRFAAPLLITPPASDSEAVMPTTTDLSNGLPTDVAAHPTYAANMTAFVGSLRQTGVGAQWPAFGSNDTLLITPQTMVKGQRAEWNADLYHELAQGIYANFVFRRYESKFSDTDSTTCFVVVSDTSGKVVAVDLMGDLK